MEDDPDPKPTNGTPPGTPPGTPAGAPPGVPQLRKKDPRKSLTIKGDFVPELRALIAKGARAKGMTQFAFVTEALTVAAQRALKGEPLDPGADQARPPAVVVDELAAAVRLLTEKVEAMEARDRAREAMAAPGNVGDGNLARDRARETVAPSVAGRDTFGDRARGFLQRGLGLLRGR